MGDMGETAVADDTSLDIRDKVGDPFLPLVFFLLGDNLAPATFKLTTRCPRFEYLASTFF